MAEVIPNGSKSCNFQLVLMSHYKIFSRKVTWHRRVALNGARCRSYNVLLNTVGSIPISLRSALKIQREINNNNVAPLIRRCYDNNTMLVQRFVRKTEVKRTGGGGLTIRRRVRLCNNANAKDEKRICQIKVSSAFLRNWIGRVTLTRTDADKGFVIYSAVHSVLFSPTQ